MFDSTAKGSKGNSGGRGPKGIRGRQGRPGPALFFDASEEVITVKGEKVNLSYHACLYEKYFLSQYIFSW